MIANMKMITMVLLGAAAQLASAAAAADDSAAGFKYPERRAPTKFVNLNDPEVRAPLERRGGCSGVDGVVNAQCSYAYDAKNCKGLMLEQKEANCDRVCHQLANVTSVTGEGDGTRRTQCKLFSDDNCQTIIANHKGSIEKECTTPEGDHADEVGNSYMCLFGC